MTRNKIVLYGHFGSGNIGNDSSLEASLYHIKKYQPQADIVCVCNGPRQIRRRFGIETLPMSGVHADEQATGSMPSRIKRVVLRLSDELLFWLKRFSWFRPGDRFIVVGTGAVDDMAVRRPWHSPYELYKWCRAAKKGGAQVIFLSVGVGPIMNRISRFLMLQALKMADYRSYREKAAFEYLHGVGFDTTGDLLYPDLVFSLPREFLTPFQHSTSVWQVVGLGLINYYGWQHDPQTGEAVYQQYIAKVKAFVDWLLKRGCTIRLISGDTTDQRPVDEIKKYIQKQVDTAGSEMLIVDPIANVGDLFAQIAQVDIVVASRFHNVLCALMLGVPVISLGYHEKNTNLMTEMGLENFCQHIEQFTFEKLVKQFECYTSDGGQAIQHILDTNETYRRLLDEQYRNILLPKDL